MFKVHTSESVSTWCPKSETLFLPHKFESKARRAHDHISHLEIDQRKEGEEGVEPELVCTQNRELII
jgi:hypothetical protein